MTFADLLTYLREANRFVIAAQLAGQTLEPGYLYEGAHYFPDVADPAAGPDGAPLAAPVRTRAQATLTRRDALMEADAPVDNDPPQETESDVRDDTRLKRTIASGPALIRYHGANRPWGVGAPCRSDPRPDRVDVMEVDRVGQETHFTGEHRTRYRWPDHECIPALAPGTTLFVQHASYQTLPVIEAAALAQGELL